MVRFSIGFGSSPTKVSTVLKKKVQFRILNSLLFSTIDLIINSDCKLLSTNAELVIWIFLFDANDNKLYCPLFFNIVIFSMVITLEPITIILFEQSFLWIKDSLIFTVLASIEAVSPLV